MNVLNLLMENYFCLNLSIIIPNTIIINPIIVDIKIFSFKKTEIKTNEIKGEKKIRLLIFEVCLVNLSAKFQTTNVNPISNIPEYIAANNDCTLIFTGNLLKNMILFDYSYINKPSDIILYLMV